MQKLSLPCFIKLRNSRKKQTIYKLHQSQFPSQNICTIDEISFSLYNEGAAVIFFLRYITIAFYSTICLKFKDNFPALILFSRPKIIETLSWMQLQRNVLILISTFTFTDKIAWTTSFVVALIPRLIAIALCKNE